MINTHATSGSSYDFFFFDANNNVWNGTTAFVTWVDANYATYRRAATELGATGNFYINNYPNGSVRWELRLRAGTLAGSTIAALGNLDPPIDFSKVVRATRISGIDYSFPTTFLTGDTGGRTLVQTALNASVGKGISSVSRIKLTTQTSVLAGVVKFLVFRGGMKVQESDLFQIPQSGTTILTFDLPIPLEFDEGDRFGIYHQSPGGVDNAIGCYTLSGATVKYATGDLSTEAALSSTASNIAMDLEFFGDGPDVAFTGDSIVEGNGTAHPNFGHFQDSVPAFQYPDATTPYWINRWTGITFHNLCKGAQTFAWVLSTGVPACVTANSKIILIHCGVNDVANGRSWSSVLSDLNAIRALVPLTTHLLLDEILPWTTGANANAANITTINTFNTNLAAWCLTNNATLVRCYNAFEDPANPGKLLPAYNQDGVHLTSIGVLLLARLQANAIVGEITTRNVDNSATLATKQAVNNLMGLL
jgi:hypothetical protein